MTHPNPSTALATVVVDELVRAGTGLVVAAPGSRSTALVLAADAHPDLETVVAVDERSAAYHALGWAKWSGTPAVVLTTSGTAVANLLPAVVEADMSETPLLVLSADRPNELRAVGANQAIDQLGIFGRFVRFEADLGAEMREEAPGFWRSAVSQAIAAARGFGGRRGPAHLNLAFREPTVPVTDDGRSREPMFPFETSGRPGDRPWSGARVGRHPSAELVEELSELVDDAARGLILGGGGAPEAAAELGEHLGWPILATAESGLRRRANVIAAGHHLVGRMEPDLILRFGTPGPSRRILEAVSGPARQVVVAASWSDPARASSLVVDADPAALARALVEATPGRSPDRWAKWWEEADRAVREVLAPELEGAISEPAMAAAVGGMGAERITVASSMPIRDMEAYAFTVTALVGNRGASGIDGLVSTALGASRGSRRAVALIGDLSLLHDANGFLVDPRPDCVFVVADNAGGGIFSFLPQAEHAGGGFERLFATPSGRDPVRVAELHGLGAVRVDSVADLRSEVSSAWDAGGCHLVIGQTDRAENVAEHERLNRLATEAVASVGDPS